MSDNTEAVLNAAWARPGSTERTGSAWQAAPAAEAAELGQSAMAHMLSAGLDLNVMLAETADGELESQLLHAIGEVDQAVKDLRYLMLAVAAAVTGMFPERDI